MEINCTGNNGNGCFHNSPAINCGCEGLKEMAEEWANKVLANSPEINYETDEAFEQFIHYGRFGYKVDDKGNRTLLTLDELFSIDLAKKL